MVGGLALSAAVEQSDPLAPFGSIRKDVKLRSEHDGRSLEYCPDNTCDRFVCSSGGCEPPLIDFSLLYLAHVSGYTELAEFQSKEAPSAMRAVLARHKTSCHESTVRDTAVCILRELHKKDRIRVSFVRYDEGERNEEPVDLEQEIARSANP